MKIRHIIIVFLVTCFLASSIYSQDYRRWEPTDGVAVRQGDHLQWYRTGAYQTEGEFAGEAALVWSDCRNGDRGVYMQVFDAEGEPKFAENGLQVVDGPDRQEDPVVTACSDGGWFVAWEDFNADSLGNIYCTKVTAGGEIVWGEENLGVPVCTVPGIQVYPVIIDSEDGGCIIAWCQRIHSVGDIYAMHVMAEGRINPDWAENGVEIVREPGAQVNHDAISDGDGGMIIVWRDGGGIIEIWAQRINPAGELQWDEGVQVCNNESTPHTPKLCPDGEGGAFIVWADHRNMRESREDIFIQRINTNGESQWGEQGEGLPLCVAEEEQLNPRIVMSEPGSAIIVWEDKRSDGADIDLYGMRVSGQNEMTFEWDAEGGVPVTTANNNQSSHRICPDGNGGVNIAWDDERDGGFPEVDIWAQTLDLDGQILWAENGIPVSSSLYLQSTPVVLPNSDGYILISWSEYGSGSNEIFGQRINQNGESLWDEGGVVVFTGISRNAFYPQILSRGNGDLAIVWLDGRFGGNGRFPFLQICHNGEDRPAFHLENRGIPILSPEFIGGGVEPQAALSGDDAIIVVWEDHRRGQWYSVYAQKISWEGELLWDDGGVNCLEVAFDVRKPMICSDGNGGAIIAYSYPTNDEYFDIYLQRLDGNGNRLWGEEGFQLTDNRVDDNVLSILADGEGGAVLVWEAQDMDTRKDLWVQRVNGNHELLWGENRPLCNEVEDQRRPVIARHEEGYVVVWQDERVVEETYVFGQFINNDGSFRWNRMEGGYIICDGEKNPLRPDVSVGVDGNIWIVWEDRRNGREENIYIQKLSARTNDMGDPVILFTTEDDQPIYDGIPVCTAANDQNEVNIVHDGNNGMWVSWKDCRGDRWSDIYATHINSDGVPFEGWPENGRIVCGATHKQQNPEAVLINSSGYDGVAVVWEDKRSTHGEELTNLYLQRLDDDMVSSVPELVTTPPSEFYLHEPFPNPFNSTTTIEYALPYASEVYLNLYNLSGQRVETLVNGRMKAGVHRVLLDAGDMTSGLYIIGLRTDGQSISQKVLLIN